METHQNKDLNWLKLKSEGLEDEDLATKVHRTLSRIGVVLDHDHMRYIDSVMFGAGIDDLNCGYCGYCGHQGHRHVWGLDTRPDGSLDIDHFNCNDCASEKDTSLVVCYIRPGGGTRRDSY